MGFTPFKRAFGYSQGRVAPSYATQPEGQYLFVLGHDEPGRFETFVSGDEIHVGQLISPVEVGAKLVRYWLRLRAPQQMPGSSKWVFEALASGSPVFSVDLAHLGSDDVYADNFAFNLHAGTSLDLAFRLRFDDGFPGGSGGEFEVELPGVYVDAVIEDLEARDLVLINMVPGPNQSQVHPSSGFQLDVSDTTPSLPYVPGTKVWASVNGGAETIVYSGGYFQPGWDGPGSSATFPSSGTLRIVAVPTVAFESLDVVTVRVVSQNVSGTGQLDKSYSYTIEDLTPPVLESVVAAGRRQVRVTFDEPVVGVDPTASNDALNPSNWSLVTEAVPAVQVEVVEVSALSELEYLLETDIELTQGAEYVLTASNIEDRFGNVVEDPTSFVALACQTVGRRFRLIEFVPKINVREDETFDLRNFLAMFQEVTNELLCDIDAWTDIIDPDVAPEPFVDAMLYDMGNPFAFASELALDDKRRLLRVLVDIYKLKGTAIGIQNVVRFFLGIEIEIVEALGEAWELGHGLLGVDTVLGEGGTAGLYGFRISAPVILTETERKRIEEIAVFMKPAHTHLLDIVDATPVPTPDVWSLGEGLLGLDTVLS